MSPSPIIKAAHPNTLDFDRDLWAVFWRELLGSTLMFKNRGNAPIQFGRHMVLGFGTTEVFLPLPRSAFNHTLVVFSGREMSILGSSSCGVSLVNLQMIKHIRSVWHKQMGWMILGLATCSCVTWSFGGMGKVSVVLFASQYPQPLPSRCSFSPLLGTVFHFSCP